VSPNRGSSVIEDSGAELVNRVTERRILKNSGHMFFQSAQFLFCCVAAFFSERPLLDRWRWASRVQDVALVVGLNLGSRSKGVLQVSSLSLRKAEWYPCVASANSLESLLPVAEPQGTPYGNRASCGGGSSGYGLGSCG
jgi:hypothetical protein